MRLVRKNMMSLIAVGVLAVGVSACGGGGSSDSANLSPDAAAGKTIFDGKCSGCHSTSGGSGTGPSLKGVAGSSVALQSGTSVTADNAYLVKSIEDPGADVVKGFPNVMSSAIPKGSVSNEEAKQLAAYIESLH
jgi:cytochrome c oxidase subunit 2